MQSVDPHIALVWRAQVPYMQSVDPHIALVWRAQVPYMQSHLAFGLKLSPVCTYVPIKC